MWDGCGCPCDRFELDRADLPTSGVFTLEGPGRVTPPLNPDCRDGKHRACAGDAWDLDTDQPADCSCGCHSPEPTTNPEE